MGSRGAAGPFGQRDHAGREGGRPGAGGVVQHRGERPRRTCCGGGPRGACRELPQMPADS